MSQQLWDTGSSFEGGEPLSDEERIARHLRKRVLDQISGNIDERVIQDFPSDRFFAGVLMPETPDQLEDRDDDLQSKMEPSALAATVRLDSGSPGDKLKINIGASVWVRVNPTLDEIRNRESFVALGDRDEDDDADEILPVFQRIELDIPSITIPYEIIAEQPDIAPPDIREQVHSKLSTAFQQARETALDNPKYDLYLVSSQDGPDEIPVEALEYEEAFETFLDERDGTPAIPDWGADLDISVSEDEERTDNSLIVDIEVKNTAHQSDEDAIYTIRDPTLFEVQLDLETEGDMEFVPFTFDPLPQDFRYNRDLWGHGRNCTVNAVDEDTEVIDGRTRGRQAPPSNPTSNHLRTEYIPQHRQLIYESADRGIDATFSSLEDLENGGFDVLESVAQEMRSYLEDVYDEALEEYESREDWNQDGRDESDFAEDRAAFERELIRFRRGIRCLRQHQETAGRAFELMNQTMNRMHEFDSWRLFQLVFIVMMVPDVASREYEDWDEVEWRTGETQDRAEMADSALEIVDVLWFPTGGGKTEAFLGVAVWSMFFDRIRGKDFGVTAWTRFPLRLLSLQQIQRMSESAIHADLVRRQEDDIGEHPSRPFSVGYLVGKRNTPNALTGFDNDNFERYGNNQELREDARILPNCPACGSRIEVEVTQNHRLTHVCSGSSFDCEWQSRDVDPSETYAEEELPVHVVDNELYRYAPSILAGTIDKITAIGYQRKMAHILSGEMDSECPIHGFASLGECTEKYGCSIDWDEFEDYATPVEAYDPAPSLMVPDELHLLEESVGSLDGHYETGVATLQSLAEAGTTKVIAPTATIKAFEDQVHHLFLRGAERFPAPGPYLRENFYAQERPESQRYYIGITPHGKTHINSIIDLLFYYHREIQDLILTAVESPNEILAGEILVDEPESQPLDTDNVNELLRTLTLYSTSLTYLLSKKEGDRLDQSIVSQLDAYLKRDGRPPLVSERLTGGTPFEEVQQTLDRLEDPWAAESEEGILRRLSDRDLISEEAADEILDLSETLQQSLDEDYQRVTADDFEDTLSAADIDHRKGLAWLLSSWLNTITATSMVSHGVDINRFNMMVFFGMPRQTAEYIQSSSRAGRKHPGLIFNVCHPIRERDLSHYHFFEKYHEYLDRLVEPVPVNRWAKNSVDRTHPGLFLGLLFNHYMYQDNAGRLYFGEEAEDFVNQVDETELKGHVLQMYGDFEGQEEFTQDAEDLTNQAISQIRLDNEQWTSNRLPRSAMRSLRDVDEQLRIRPEFDFDDVFEAYDQR